MIKENWKQIPEYSDYEISTLGRVRSLKWDKKEILKLQRMRRGYQTIHLGKNGTRKTFLVATLVLNTFVGSCPKGMEASHLNNMQTDNRLSNLKWETPIENRRRIKGFRRLSIKIFNFRIMLFVGKEK